MTPFDRLDDLLRQQHGFMRFADAVQIDDGVVFRTASISEIMDKAEYPGVRVSLESGFDGVHTPLKIDLSTCDAITPGRSSIASG